MAAATDDVDAKASWLAHRQGLTGELNGASPQDTLLRVGWARSVGGATPYLTFFSRAGSTREEVDAATANQSIHELPAVRGCTYVLPSQHFAVGLTIGQPYAGADLKSANRVAGYTEADAAKLDKAVLKALAAGAANPAELKTRLGNAITNFGEEGKKKGVTTSLPISLGRLQARGEIRRISADGRLDSQRYAYELWPEGPLAGHDLDAVLAQRELAQWYFGWVGAASPAEFSWFTAWTKTKVTKVLAELDLAEAPDGRLALKSDLAEYETHKVGAKPDVRLIGNLDSHILLRRNHLDLMSAQDQESAIARSLLKTSGAAGAALSDLPFHAIVDRGRIVGLWDFSHADSEIIHVTFSAQPKAVSSAIDAAVSRTQAFILNDLEDARMMSLDSPKGREKRLIPLREAAQ